MPGTSPAMMATNAFPRFCTSPANLSRTACFPGLLAPNKDREIGGGRASRQPGQVRKEAALTRSGSGRSSVSYLFFRANRAKWANPSGAGFCSGAYSAKVGTGFAITIRASNVPQAGFERQSIADRSMTDAGIPVTPPTDVEGAHQAGFDLGGPPRAGQH